ncbi:MAG: DUF1501 domain-containing protein [Acidobacteriota bacterium]|nr:MAG: DUF1501 domain-containing protein [Acidobacteriota bacterium]
MIFHRDWTRRSFLKGSGLTLAGFGLTSLFPSSFLRHAMAADATSDKRLLFIFLRGGIDGINTLIPQGDPDYNTTNRPTLYIDPLDSIDLGNGFAHFHPGLSDLMDLHNAGQLASVHRVGYPGQSRSHFDSQRIYENGDPTQTTLFEGWLYRYVRENGVSSGVRLPVLTSQSTTPLIVRGAEKYVNVANPDSFDYLDQPPKRDKYEQAWERVYADVSRIGRHRGSLSALGLELIGTLDEYRSWDQVNWNPTHPNTGNYLFPVDEATNPNDPSGPGGKMFPSSAYSYFRALKVCALSLLEAKADGTTGTRVAGTQLGNFDHHDGQGGLAGDHRDLLKQLGYGLDSLYVALSGQATNEPRMYPSVWSDTVVITLSEFGRTTKENGSQGTDHAEGTTVFAAGGYVNGGVYNCDSSSWPAGVMFDIYNRYLSHATDYRAVMWEILRDHMGASQATVDTIFPGYTALNPPELGLIGV